MNVCCKRTKGKNSFLPDRHNVQLKPVFSAIATMSPFIMTNFVIDDMFCIMRSKHLCLNFFVGKIVIALPISVYDNSKKEIPAIPVERCGGSREKTVHL